MTTVPMGPTAEAEPDSGIGSGFCRVQIAAPTTRVDLALPTGVPLAGLLPAIVGYAEQDPPRREGWALSRLDGSRLDPAAGLAAAGVREGELLLLHAAQDELGPAALRRRGRGARATPRPSPAGRPGTPG